MRLLPTTPLGRYRDRLIVSTSTGKALNIPVTANVLGPVKVSPQIVSFGIIEGREPIKRNLKLDIVGKEALEIDKITVQDEAISTKVVTVKQGHNYVIEVTLDPSKITKDLKGFLEVTFADEQKTNVLVSLFGVQPPSK